MIQLTKRWTPLRYHKIQQDYWNSPHRFNAVPAGRRSGKTEIAKRKVIHRALSCSSKFDNPRYFCAAPTRGQAVEIFWDDLKLMVPQAVMAGPPRESEPKMIRLVTGASIYIVGLDKPQRIEGQPWDGGIVDEIADCKPQAWEANILPALSDRKGWCDLIGVPGGRNHYYDIYRAAVAQMAEKGDKSEWGAYHWVSAEILDPDEIAMRRETMDPLLFQQEYEASFLNFGGRAYYTFDEAIHCRKLAYDRNKPLIFCFDFNVEPGVAAVVQEQELPNGVFGTGVIGEVWIPRNSNTPAVCRRLVADWGDHSGQVICYGDATGGARGSAKVAGSDWDLIKAELRPKFTSRIRFDVPDANPPERSRVNAVNTRLKTAAGTISMMVDPTKAPHVVRDLEGVAFLEGGSGEIDKKKTPELTHISDALGYYIERKFPVIKLAGARAIPNIGHMER